MHQLRLFALALMLVSSCAYARPQTAASASASTGHSLHTFGVEGDHFALDGKPFQIISGEMHYPRIPRAYWRQELKLARAMGLNTITTYVFWNLHEAKPGTYDFSGNNDVAEFIREAQQEGLYVLLRPGPYVCAEWEWGGYPAWLLRNKGIQVRSTDPVYMKAAGTWLKRLGQELAPLQIGNGGPIVGVQVENEYGSFGSDHAYMEAARQQVLDAGFTKAMLYTADGADVIAKGSLPDLPAVANFGTGDAERSFRVLKRTRPQGPFMSGEYWAGWFDHWGVKHETTSTAKQVAELDWMLTQGYSLSLYMVHGGTSFGWMNGANVDHGVYHPDVTSYDYGAALDESGRPTEKYAQFREVIGRVTGQTLPPVPIVAPMQAIPSFKLTASAPLLRDLPKPVSSADPMTMEELGQSYGYVLYRTTLPHAGDGTLTLHTLHDYAVVYADGKELGILDRREGKESLDVNLTAGTRLDILLENTGRVNYGPALPGEKVGILGGITLNGEQVHDWQQFSMPLEQPAVRKFSTSVCTGACLYRGSFTAASQADTFLDTSKIAKGFVWVNGIPLGRAWSIGPQTTLYLPGPWLRRGRNDIVVLDLEATGPPVLQGLVHPMLDAPTPPPPPSRIGEHKTL
jgi:beta-galactosidase